MALTHHQYGRTRSLLTIDSEALFMNSLFQRISTYYTQLKIRIFLSLSLAGCCTSCAVRIKSGDIRQPEALGISAELKAKGYALLCVGFPTSDIEVETQDEDEVYWLQFGRYFARGPIERDDYALELAMGDE
nr:PREDICTED: ferredoxin isoform X2 [Daucus carota subsp. sativus]